MTRISLAEAKECLEDLLDRVAAEGETVLITENDQPLAKIVPAGREDEPHPLSGFEGWLEDDDPFFSTIEEIVERRFEHRPRVLGETSVPRQDRMSKR